jgi:hypothetical protein
MQLQNTRKKLKRKKKGSRIGGRELPEFGGCWSEPEEAMASPLTRVSSPPRRGLGANQSKHYHRARKQSCIFYAEINITNSLQ